MWKYCSIEYNGCLHNTYIYFDVDEDPNIYYGYELGYNQGNQDGYNNGYNQGNQDGYNQGNQDGYNQGNQDGYISEIYESEHDYDYDPREFDDDDQGYESDNYCGPTMWFPDEY